MPPRVSLVPGNLLPSRSTRATRRPWCQRLQGCVGENSFGSDVGQCQFRARAQNERHGTGRADINRPRSWGRSVLFLATMASSVWQVKASPGTASQ